MEYFEPETISEAVSLLAKFGESAKVVAGGTDVMVDIKFAEEPPCLVNIKRIQGLNYIRQDSGSLRIGPLTTIREIETNQLVREKFSVLWGASHQFASLQIRNTATIGGNICRASPSGELLAPLLVLEAKAIISVPGGEKKVAFDEFFIAPGKTILGFKGLLKEIEIPFPSDESRGVYLKHAVRGAMDIAMVGVAVHLVPDSARKLIKDVRIGLGAVAPTPIRAKKAEDALRGKPLDQGLVEAAGRKAAAESKPITDQRASGEYRTWIVEALTRKGVSEAWKAATGREVK